MNNEASVVSGSPGRILISGTSVSLEFQFIVLFSTLYWQEKPATKRQREPRNPGDLKPVRYCVIFSTGICSWLLAENPVNDLHPQTDATSQSNHVAVEVSPCVCVRMK